MIIYLIVDSTKLTMVEYTDFWIRLPMLLTLCFSCPHELQHTRLLCLHCPPELTQTHVIKSLKPSNPLVLCCLLLCLPSILPNITVFFNELALLIRWLKYWSFSFSISPPNKYPGLISFRIDWFDFLAYQGTLNSLLQHHSSKAYGH